MMITVIYNRKTGPEKGAATKQKENPTKDKK